MLAEFVITPDVFDGSENVLRERLNQLKQVFFPRGGVSTFVACQLGEEAWQRAVANKILMIKNRDLRSNAQALFLKLINDAAVVRCHSTIDASCSEERWIQEASESSVRAPLDGIVGTVSNVDSDLVMTFDEFVGDEICEKYSNPRLVDRSLDSQISVLRTLCLHSDWLIVRLPQIRGGSDDEIVTLKQILTSISKRASIKSPATVDIHVCPQQKIPMANLQRNIENEVDSLSLKNCNWHLRSVPKFIDRIVFGGEYAKLTDLRQERRARWLLTMSHVAVGSKQEKSKEKCTWALHDRKSAHLMFQQLQQELTALNSAQQSQ